MKRVVRGAGILLVIAAALWNLVSHLDYCNFRSRSDYGDLVAYINRSAIPGTWLFTSNFDFWGISAFQMLGRVRRDIGYWRHNNEIDSTYLKSTIPKARLASVLYFRDLHSKKKSIFFKDIKSVLDEYFVVALEDQPSGELRLAVADTGNIVAFQALEPRNIYYLLPKVLESVGQVAAIDLNAESSMRGAPWVLSNIEFDKDANGLFFGDLTYPANLFVPLSPTGGRIELVLNVEGKSAVQLCEFRSAQLVVYFNNHLISQVDFGREATGVSLNVPAAYRSKNVNVLSMFVAFNGHSQYSDRSLPLGHCRVRLQQYKYRS